MTPSELDEAAARRMKRTHWLKVLVWSRPFLSVIGGEILLLAARDDACQSRRVESVDNCSDGSRWVDHGLELEYVHFV